jgi:hypothetical protein
MYQHDVTLKHAIDDFAHFTCCGVNLDPNTGPRAAPRAKINDAQINNSDTVIFATLACTPNTVAGSSQTPRAAINVATVKNRLVARSNTAISTTCSFGRTSQPKKCSVTLGHMDIGS